MAKKKPEDVWCVKHKGGWCACETNCKPAEGRNNIATKCDHVVTGP